MKGYKKRVSASRKHGKRGANKRSRSITRPLRQGVGKVAARPGIAKPKKAGSSRAGHIRALNANHPSHLALPRAVGPYTITRATKIVDSNSKVMFFGTFQTVYPDTQDAIGWDNEWTNVCCLGSVNAGIGMDATSNTRSWTMSGINSTTLGGSISLVPSAMTIQCLNPEALQTTQGIIYGGVLPVVPKLLDDSRTWNVAAAGFVNFCKPRLMSAAKLALRGVEASLVPMDMDALSDFTTLSSQVDRTGDDGTTVTSWNTAATNNLSVQPTGFSPLVIYNPNQVALQYLVTVEYRMRFDIAHPAVSTHSFHPPATLRAWHDAVEGMTSLGHGVRDIAEVVADVGRAAAGFL